ncbi:hypothetical protein D3P04_09305 [Paracoccus onubensis]|uniref:Uncharacterized protein n=1 Tax=Paracoccus onubensis TaxID=1675788 RepID=A0A418SYB6_9RHOB|nr:hypothetical protein D3P04_09305 [Paracoccus onubensis]
MRKRFLTDAPAVAIPIGMVPAAKRLRNGAPASVQPGHVRVISRSGVAASAGKDQSEMNRTAIA